MSINESSANTLVRFNGLGIICFNEAQNAEIGILRDGKTYFVGQDPKPEFMNDTEKDLIVYQDFRVFENLPKENVEIEIKAAQNPSIAGFEIYQTDADFDRLEGADVNDFRWIVDLDELHGENLTAQNDAEKYPVTKLFIADGLFYTHKLDTELCFEKVAKDTDGNEQKRETFGNVAETIGIKIEADAVSFSIRFDGKEESVTLEKNAGLPYRIEIANMDYNEGASYSDLPDYYKYLASATGEKFELEPLKDDENGGELSGGSVVGKQFCHPVRAGIETIDAI